MNITIERLQLDELKAFLRIQADDTFPDLKEELRLNMLANKWHNQAEFCTCRDEDGLLIGMIAFYANQPYNEVAFIPHVYVASQHRCKGIFKQMLHKVEHIVRERGFSTVKLEVQKDNKNALRSYERTGFLFASVAGSDTVFLLKKI
jgi:ribosomal protein S18 acetylase RimI-like enzyme